jgi:hypothetical protein
LAWRAGRALFGPRDHDARHRLQPRLQRLFVAVLLLWFSGWVVLGAPASVGEQIGGFSHVMDDGKSKSVNPNPFPLQEFGFSPNQPAPRCSRAIAFGDRIAIQSRDRSPKFGPDDRGGSVGAIGASRDGEPRWKTGGARVAMKTPFRLCRSTGRV